jgi:adenosylhomocysteine nucleosidase
MITALIIEDDEAKCLAIKQEISNYFGQTELKIDHCATFAESSKAIYEISYDIIVTDLLLPRRAGDEPEDFSEDLLTFLSASEANSRSLVVAITRFETLVSSRSDEFKRAGIFLLQYDSGDDWKSCLRVCMQRVEQTKITDFVIVCALDEERAAFRSLNDQNTKLGELSRHRGLNCRSLEIGELKGVCVLQPRMGLVDAAAISAQALEIFNPKIICMSGICAGFADEIPLGSVLVSDMCWEHQAGKWKSNDFQLSHYQEPLQINARTILSQMIEEDKCLSTLRDGLSDLEPYSASEAKLVLTVSGSAVIASTAYADKIRAQHPKVGGLDMEVYGLYRAAALHDGGVVCFAAKTVVDHANESKADDIHQAGAILSARFVVAGITKIMAALKS